MRTTTEQGRRAEQLAGRFLQQQGYRILEVNYRGRRGELDIIAEEGAVLCFVEVRSRRSRRFGDPLETVDRRKQQRLIRTAQQYLTTHRPTGPLRFDVVAIVYEPQLDISLVRGAFDAGEAW